MLDDMAKLMGALHDVERKLDVLIEAQGLEHRVAEREASERSEQEAAAAAARNRSRPAIP